MQNKKWERRKENDTLNPITKNISQLNVSNRLLKSSYMFYTYGSNVYFQLFVFLNLQVKIKIRTLILILPFETT